jgi:hypothetical protein
LQGFGLPPSRDVAWKAFESFWRRPWFRRAWVIQEFILAQNVKIICGQWECHWQSMADAVDKIDHWGLTHKLTHGHRVSHLEVAEILEINAGSTAMYQLCNLKAQSDMSLLLSSEVWKL